MENNFITSNLNKKNCKFNEEFKEYSFHSQNRLMNVIYGVLFLSLSFV